MITYDVPTLLKYQTKCSDRGLSQLKKLPDTSILQLKADGWWCLVVVEKGQCTVYNVGGRVLWSKRIELLANDNGVLIGEAGYGTNWALRNFNQHVYVHDLVWWNGKDYEQDIYQTRYDAVRKIFNYAAEMFVGFMSLIPTYWFEQLDDVWKIQVINNDWEGIVVKPYNHHFGQEFLRCKKQVTIDYVCTNIVEGGGRNQGRCGAVVGSLYVNGRLTGVCSVGGGMTDAMRIDFWENKEKYIGKVFEAYGAALFDSGALRHPQFKRWRDDKAKEDCHL